MKKQFLRLIFGYIALSFTLAGMANAALSPTAYNVGACTYWTLFQANYSMGDRVMAERMMAMSERFAEMRQLGLVNSAEYMRGLEDARIKEAGMTPQQIYHKALECNSLPR